MEKDWHHQRMIQPILNCMSKIVGLNGGISLSPLTAKGGFDDCPGLFLYSMILYTYNWLNQVLFCFSLFFTSL